MNRQYNKYSLFYHLQYCAETSMIVNLIPDDIYIKIIFDHNAFCMYAVIHDITDLN